MRRVWLLAAMGLTLSACETVTPYRPLIGRANHYSDGYSDTRIDSDRWRVTFFGNNATPRDMVERYVLYRAAQLTLQQGHEQFEVLNRNTEVKTIRVGVSFGIGAWGGYVAPQWGMLPRGFYSGYGQPSTWYGGPGSGGGPDNMEQVNRYDSSSEIQMGDSLDPAGDAKVFDARNTVASLQPFIVFPRSSRV